MFFRRLYQNNLTGSIPPSLGNLTSLQELKLEKNAFSGSIPSSLGNLKALRFLYVVVPKSQTICWIVQKYTRVMLIILLGSFEFWLFVAQEVEREYADRHCSIGSPLPCHCWELDRAVSNKAIWTHHYHFSMGTLYHGIMFQFHWLALTQEQLPAFRNIASNNLDSTVRSSELRGTLYSVRFCQLNCKFI